MDYKNYKSRLKGKLSKDTTQFIDVFIAFVLITIIILTILK